MLDQSPIREGVVIKVKGKFLTYETLMNEPSNTVARLFVILTRFLFNFIEASFNKNQ